MILTTAGRGGVLLLDDRSVLPEVSFLRSPGELPMLSRDVPLGEVLRRCSRRWQAGVERETEERQRSVIELQEHDEGVLLPVKAQPRARRNAVVGIQAGQLKVAVTEPPEKGRANDRIQRVLADALGLSRQQLRLHSGASSSQKKFCVMGISLPELRQLLDELLGEK